MEHWIAQTIRVIEDGIYQPSMKVRMDELEARKAVLTRELEHAKAPRSFTPALLRNTVGGSMGYSRRCRTIRPASRPRRMPAPSSEGSSWTPERTAQAIFAWKATWRGS